MIPQVSQELLQKYNVAGPRYTSYPTAPVWSDAFGASTFETALAETNQPGKNPHPLSLYTHLPFCEHRCLFCGCNVVITQQREQAEKYLGYLFREIERLSTQIDTTRPVVQYHWGGGTPTYLSPEQMARLFRFQTERFPLAPEAEIAIEVDPRVTTSEHLHTLKELGFNRISLGVQDFDPAVQAAVERIQPTDMTEAMVNELRTLGFEGINFDLIYGLPHQTVESFERTLQEVIRLGPDRIALYNYAHVPWLSPHQKQIPETALPEGETKFEIFRRALEAFGAAGYRYIGMDHFAKPEDELSRALENATLSRNFMGYTVQRGGTLGSDLVGMGVSAISMLQRHYAQNEKKLSRYYEAIEAGQLPVHRGYALSDDDVLRRTVILAILCQGRLVFSDIEQAFNLNFKQTFTDSLAQLRGPAEDGLVRLKDNSLELTPLGRIFSRNIAMPFDAYLGRQTGEKPTFSKTL